MDPTRRQWLYLKAVLGWLFFNATALFLFSRAWPSPAKRAVMSMGYCLVLVWVGLCGALMWRFRDPICRFVRRIPLDWRLKFVVFCTLLALLEEVVTTTLTNLAPFFGARVGQAYITASANYLDVVCLHSVVAFIPLFVGWAVILWRYDFSPFWVFALFGVTGTLAEMVFAGLWHAIEYGMWAWVYGLMVWLPGRCIPADRGARKPAWWLYPLAIIVPFFFEIAVPTIAIANHFYPNHPRMHFPPIR